jgi:hypothetical protein
VSEREEAEIQRYVVALEELSPMPSDEALENDTEWIDRYAAILQTLEELNGQHDCRIVAALINSFGPGDGFEVYWSTVHLIEASQCAETYYLIEHFLVAGSPGVRKWCCLLLGRTGYSANLGLLIGRLEDSDTMVIVEALSAIRMVACDHPYPEAIASVAAMTVHPDPEIARVAQKTLAMIDGHES